MYSCCSGSCLLKFVSSLRPGHRDPAERGRDEREGGEDQLAMPEDPRLEPGRDLRVARVLHGLPPGRASRRTPPSPATISAPSPEGSDRGDRLAVVLLREREAAPAVMAHEDHAGKARHDDRAFVDARAGVEERRRAGLDRGPGRAAILGAEQVSAQAEGEQRIALERQDAVEGAVIRRRQLAPVRPVVVGAEQPPRLGAEVHAPARSARDRVQVELEAEVDFRLHLVLGRRDFLGARQGLGLERHLAPDRAAVRRHVDDAVGADRDAMRGVGEADVEERLRVLRLEVDELPGLAAILRAQDRFHVADGPAVLLVREPDGGQVRARGHLRLRPGLARIVRVQDVAALADRDDALAREGEVEQERLDRERRDDGRLRRGIRRGRVLRQCLRRHREGERREREPAHFSACRALRSRPA